MTDPSNSVSFNKGNGHMISFSDHYKNDETKKSYPSLFMLQYYLREAEENLSLDDIEELCENFLKGKVEFIYTGRAIHSTKVNFFFYTVLSQTLEQHIIENEELQNEDFIILYQEDSNWYGFNNYLLNPHPKIEKLEMKLIEALALLDEDTEDGFNSLLFTFYSSSEDEKNIFFEAIEEDYMVSFKKTRTLLIFKGFELYVEKIFENITVQSILHHMQKLNTIADQKGVKFEKFLISTK